MLKNISALIVDDESDLREILIDQLELLDADVEQSGSVEEALQKLKDKKFDIVVSDIRMPGSKNGIDLLKYIRQKNYLHPAVILITGYTDLQVEDAFHIGADGVLAKPFDLDYLARCIESCLQTDSERWTKKIADKATKKIKREYESIDEAIKTKELSMGRGGIFLKDPPPALSVGEIVDLNLNFSAGEIKTLKGLARCQWVRVKSSGKTPSVFGLQYEYLQPISHTPLIQWLKKNSPQAFIPRF